MSVFAEFLPLLRGSFLFIYIYINAAGIIIFFCSARFSKTDTKELSMLNIFHNEMLKQTLPINPFL